MTEKHQRGADNWKRTTKAHLAKARTARQRIKQLHAQAAINKPSAMAGKVVAVNPAKQEAS